jgi:hypothetical protein
MKKLCVLFLLSLTLSGARAQVLATANSADYHNILKMSASQFTRSTFQMGYEHFFQPVTSFYIAAGMNFRDSDYEKDWGLRTELQMRFHVYTVIKPSHSSRLYFAPYLMDHYLETESRDYSSGYTSWSTNNFNAVGGGMLFGWSYSFANRINLDIYTGGGLRKTFGFEQGNGYYSDNVFDYGYSGIVPRLGIDVGFWF